MAVLSENISLSCRGCKDEAGGTYVYRILTNVSSSSSSGGGAGSGSGNGSSSGSNSSSSSRGGSSSSSHGNDSSSRLSSSSSRGCHVATLNVCAFTASTIHILVLRSSGLLQCAVS